MIVQAISLSLGKFLTNHFRLRRICDLALAYKYLEMYAYLSGEFCINVGPSVGRCERSKEPGCGSQGTYNLLGEAELSRMRL